MKNIKQLKLNKLNSIDYLKENKMEFYLCRICQDIVSRSHFDSEEHIKKLNTACDIEIKNLSKELFINQKSIL